MPFNHDLETRGDSSLLDGVEGLQFRGDAIDTVFIGEQLTLVRDKVYEAKPKPLKFSARIPTDVSGGAGLDATSFNEQQSRAKFHQVGAKSFDADLADVKRQRITTPVMNFIAAYGWTMFEMERASRAGMPLQVAYAMALRRAYDELLQKCKLIGHPDAGCPGFLNHPAIDCDKAPATLTPSSTAQQFVDVLGDFVDGIEEDSLGAIDTTNALFVPDKLFNAARKKYFTSTSDNVLRRFREEYGFQIEKMSELRDVKKIDIGLDASESSTTSVICTGRFDDDVLSQQVPRPFYQLVPAQRKAGVETIVLCVTDVGGLEVYDASATRVLYDVWSEE